MKAIKNIFVVSIFGVALLVSGAVQAKAKFYWNVCYDVTGNVGPSGIDFLAMDGTPIITISSDKGSLKVVNGALNPIPNCQTRMTNIVADDSNSGNFANWRPGDGQRVATTIFFTSPTFYQLNGTQGKCPTLSVPVNFSVGSMTGSWVNFAPANIGSIPTGQGLIKIKVSFPDKGTPSCSATVNVN